MTTESVQAQTDWDEIESNSRTACVEVKAEYGAEVADPKLGLSRLAARVAQRANLPEFDTECWRTARKMLSVNPNVDALIAAYAVQELDAWWVQTATKQTPFWQMQYILTEARRIKAKQTAPRELVLDRYVRDERERIAQRRPSWVDGLEGVIR